MLLLHTSDWHLGRSLHGFSLGEEQADAVDAIIRLAVERDVDAFVLSGDVFDRAVPPVESLRLLNSALERLSAAGITVIVIAGNHDSGDRLATYAGLLRHGVHLVGALDEVGVGIELHDADGPVVVYAVPYLDPDAARQALAPGPDPLERSHEAVVVAALDAIETDIERRGHPRAIAIGHAFVVAAAPAEPVDASVTTESERDLTVGGVQVVPASVFAGRGLSYVALGHLHRPQQVGIDDPVMAYSGSLLRYSLSEAQQEKSVALVDVGPVDHAVEVVRVPIPGGRGMARLRDSLERLTGPEYVAHRDDFVELIVTDDTYPERMHARLDAVFPYALVKLHRPESGGSVHTVDRGDARGREPVEVMADFLRKVTGREPTPAEAEVLRHTYEVVRAVS